MAHPPRIPVLLDDSTPVVYFITLCVDQKQSVLSNATTWSAIKNAVIKLDKWSTLALLAMPDHIHALITPMDRHASPGIYSNWFKRWVRADTNSSWNWQPGCFDRLLRNDESAQEKWKYIRENPVKAGLVAEWWDWPYQIGFQEVKN